MDVKSHTMLAFTLFLAAGAYAVDPPQQIDGLPTGMNNLIMKMTEEGEVQLFTVQQAPPEGSRLQFIDPNTDIQREDHNFHQEPFRPESLGSIQVIPGPGDAGTKTASHSIGHVYRPGSQGSIVIEQQLSPEQQRTYINTLADYASRQVVATAKALCGSESSMRPESISIAAGGVPIQVSVTWSVERACQVSRSDN